MNRTRGHDVPARRVSVSAILPAQPAFAGSVNYHSQVS
jgi:hypothetical protein